MYDRMVLLLDIWLSLILGIVYLTLQAFPIIFAGKHGFTPAQTGLSFLGVFVGLMLALASMAFWDRYHRRLADAYRCNPPPEVWLTMGKVGGVLIPLGLFTPCFASYIIAYELRRFILPRIYDIRRCPLDRAHHLFHTVRHRDLPRLHLRLHLFRNRVPPNGGGSAIRERSDADMRRRCVSALLEPNVPSHEHGGRDGVLGRDNDPHGSVAVSPLSSRQSNADQMSTDSCWQK